MRNFEERKAEVFRRSENRIQANRVNRKRYLCTGALLSFVVVIGSLIAVPNLLPVSHDVTVESDTPTEKTAYIQVEVTNRDDSRVALKEQTDDVMRLYGGIDDFFEPKENANAGVSNTTTTHVKTELYYESFAESGASSAVVSEYTITFTTSDGENVAYVLNGRVLFNQTTNKRVLLTEQQRVWLLTELGL